MGQFEHLKKSWTKGTWAVGNGSFCDVVSGDTRICLVSPTEEREANANLISAAPEAIEFISDLLKENDDIWLSLNLSKAMVLRAEQILVKAYNF